MKITVENTVKVFDGREYPVVITKRIGRDTYCNNGEIIEADEYCELDYGPKMGVARAYIHYPKHSTPENDKKCIDELCRIAGLSVMRRSREAE